MSHYSMRAKLDPDVKRAAEEHFRLEFNRRKLVLPHFIWNPYAQAHLSAGQSGIQSIIDQVLKPYGIETFYEKSQLAVQPLVRVKIVVAEINKSARRKLGIEWPQSVSAQLAPRWQNPQAIELSLHALEEN